jgi:Mrp family chromosome partitioning ATPase
MIVKKAYKMAEMMNIPVLGIVENMSYVKCPDCGKKIEIFSSGKTESVADELGVPLLGKLPIDKDLAQLIDNGCIELLKEDLLQDATEKLLSL